MRINFSSLRTQFIFMILFMGSAGIVTPIYILHLNHQQNIEHTRLATVELIKQETMTLTDTHSRLLNEYGLQIQKDPLFRKAILQSNYDLVKKMLNDQFDQYYKNVKGLVISKIFVFDVEYNNLTESDSGESKTYNAKYQICAQLPFEAKKRTGIARLKLMNSFCFHEEHALNSIIVPINTLVPIGYLQIVSRLHTVFKRAEKKMRMPIKIMTAVGEVSYQSINWIVDKKNIIDVVYEINDIRGNHVISIVMQKDISKLNEAFENSRLLIISLVSLITLIVISFFYRLFEKMLITPLLSLGVRLKVIEADENVLGKQLKLTGSQEIQVITAKFNALSEKLSSSYESLENLAYIDQLTLLPNREKLKEIIGVYSRLSQHNNMSFSLMVIGLDRFKVINDTLGHYAGDRLLIQVGKRLQYVIENEACLKATETEEKMPKDPEFISRLGADEFAIVFPSISSTETISLIAKKILLAIKDTFEIEQFKLNVGASIGISICPDHGDTAALLMQNSDIAMHYAKEGKKGFVIYTKSILAPSMNILNIDNELRKAIARDELQLFFQPKIDLKTGKISAVEVLLRWVHEEFGFVSPDVFITVAEQTGLINDVTKWVLHETFVQKQIWERNSINLSVSVNLSAINLWDKSLLVFLRQELRAHNIMPQSIILELTETAVMSDPAYAISKLEQLSDLGLKISIDDFGTGYSSLSYLKKLPVDEIKIDRSFVMDMVTDENDSIIVQSTIDLAHNMGLKVVAEGVETQEALDELKRYSCDLAQGFYMAKPMNNEDFMVWLKTSPWGR